MSDESNISVFEKILMNIDEDKILSRENCLNIYRYWWFGKRIVNAIIRFAFSSERIIDSDIIPKEAKDRFMKISKKKKQDYYIKNTIANSRIYGMSVIAVLHKYKDLSENLLISDMGYDNWRFCSYDPQSTAGTMINQDSWSYNFLKAESIQLGGKKLGANRGTILLNGDLQYLSYTESTYTYGGVSVFYNMLPLIRGTVSGIISLRRMAAKASAVVVKGDRGSKLNGIIADAAKKSLEFIKSLTNTGAVHIDKNADVSFFSMTGVSEVDAILTQMNEQILIALDDTPASILLDRAISSGLTEGNPDYKVTVTAVESFREMMVDPLYEFTDPFIQDTAWTDEFILKIKQANPEEYGNMGPSAIRTLWKNDFSYKYGSLFPKTDKEKLEENGEELSNLLKAKALGANAADIKNEVSEKEIFQTDFDFDFENIDDAEEQDYEINPEAN